MEQITWGTLPSEILIKIFKNLGQGTNFIQYLLVSKQWHLAGLSFWYKNIYLNGKLTGTLSGRVRLEAFCDLIKNPAYGVGRYVKDINFQLSADNTRILGLLMKYCPNVKKFIFSHTTAVCNYIESYKENDGRDVWKNLQYIDTYRETDTPFYKCIQVFRDSLNRLSFEIVPIFDDRKSEKENFYSYLEAFTNLDTLDMSAINVVSNIFDCDELLQYCPKLSALFITMNDQSTSQSLSPTQYKLIDEHEVALSLKILDIINYTPINALQEFIYIRTKFPNLTSLELHQDFGTAVWPAISDTALDIMIKYLLSLERFLMRTCHHDISVELVKQYFDIYIRYVKTRTLTIMLCNQQWHRGICIENRNASFATDAWSYKLGNPNMFVRFNRGHLLNNIGNNQQAMDIFTSVLNYVGPKLDILFFDVVERFPAADDANVDPEFHDNVLPLILNLCPKLQELSLTRIISQRCTSFDITSTHNHLRKIRLCVTNDPEDTAFFNALSLRLPNLSHIELKMDKDEDCTSFDLLNMPNTNLKELSIGINQNNRTKWSYVSWDDVHMKEEVVIKITSKSGPYGQIEDVYYHANTCSKNEIGKKNHILQLKSKNDTLDNSNELDSSFSCHIICSSLQTFKLDTYYNKFTLSL